MPNRDEARLRLDLAHKTGIHFLINPRLVNRSRSEQHEEIGAVAEAFINLPTQAVSSPDLPLGPPCINAVGLEGFRDTLRQIAIFPSIAQKSFMYGTRPLFD
jgi:hypothetical protein